MIKCKEKIFDYFDRTSGLWLSLPAIICLSVFVIYPFLVALKGSLTNSSMYSVLGNEETTFVGIKNYYSLFSNKEFLKTLKNTLYFVGIVVPLQTVLALFMAVLVNGSLLWQKILKFSFFLPVIISMAVLSVVWGLLFNPTSSPFNEIFLLIGIPKQKFLSDPGLAMLCIAVMSIWQGAGFQMMLYLAGLQTIPDELYEAAETEGAGRVRQFFLITLPLLKNTTLFVVTITTIFAFKLFVQPHLLTQGGPGGATKTIILKMYDEAFVNGNYGIANSIAIIFFILVIVVTLFIKLISPKEEKS
jgi:fructooligosaccharide transport system permease protein